MIRLIASDIDGTLLPEGTNKIDPEFAEVVKELRKEGVMFAAASGRGYESAANLFAELVDDIIIMVENGGYAMQGRKQLFIEPFDVELSKEILEYVHKIPDARMYLMSKTDYGYTDSTNDSFIRDMEKNYSMRFIRVPSMVDIPEGTLKISVNTESDARITAEAAKKYFGDRATIFAAGAHWTDFEPPHVNKGNGLKRLQEVLGIAKAETAAFGDNLNDMDMLMSAGESYAVADAREEVKKAAAHIAGSSNEKGVINVMKQFLKEIRDQK